MSILLIWVSASLAFAEPETHTKKSAHYRLFWEGEAGEAETMSRVLEAAWKPFTEFFQAAPKLKKDEKLPVRFFKTRENWEAGLKADGATPPRSGGGYYWPASKTAYLYRQPTRYYTRALLIHEVCHQFHFLSCTGNRNPKAVWYTEGVVEHLAWHTWDGETLELGIVPLSLKDYPAKALEALDNGKMDLETLVDGGDHRPLGAMLVRYLVQGEKGRLRTRFERLARALNKGSNPSRAFRSCLGEPRALQPRFVAWLRGAQEPWTPVFNEWERIGPGRFQGTAKGVTSSCRLKGAVRSLEATLKAPEQEKWEGGLLLHFENNKNYTLALVTHRMKIKVNRMRNGKWVRLASDTCPRLEVKDRVKFRAVREGKQVRLEVEGKTVGPFELPGAHFGLALDSCTLRFQDVSWVLEK